MHNSYKPLEVLLWAKAPQDAVTLVRPLLPRLFVRVLPGSTSDFARLAQQIRYDRLLILDSAARFQADVLGDWLERQRTDAPATLLCRKGQLASLSGRPLSLALDQFASALGQSTPSAVTPAAKAVAKQKPQAKEKQPAPAKAQVAPAGKAPPKPELSQQVKDTEAEIQRLETQLSQIDQDIAALEARYLLLADNTLEKQALKDQLEDQVLASCRLLVELKDTQDNLQELRIRSLCGQ